MAYTTVDNPELFFQTKLFTGTGSGTQAVTLDGSENMQPDFVWTKDREANSSHDLYDSVRGVGKRIRSDYNSGQATNSDMLSAFNTNGFTVGTQDGVQYSTNDGVAWCWRMGTSFSNDASATSVGTIDSSGTISTTAGQSIIKFSGTGSQGTVAHGLGAVPNVIFFKRLDANGAWASYHKSLGATKYMRLDSTSAEITASDEFNDTVPTSTVFTVDTDGGVNASGTDNMITYCFSEVKGYSKFGTYIGNGSVSDSSSAVDGTFVYTGFKPAWIMWKNSSNSGAHWIMVDNKRSPFNKTTAGQSNGEPHLGANRSNAEENSEAHVDLLSNGFKFRSSSNNNFNYTGQTYIYLAFAESPLVNSNGIPNNAR